MVSHGYIMYLSDKKKGIVSTSWIQEIKDKKVVPFAPEHTNDYNSHIKYLIRREFVVKKNRKKEKLFKNEGGIILLLGGINIIVYFYSFPFFL